MPSEDYPWGASSAGDFTIELLGDEGLAIVKLSGELDIATAPQLRECLVGLSAHDAAEVRLNLDGVTFLDSTGISVIVMACKRIRLQGGSFSLTGSQSDVHRVLEVTGVLEYLRAPPVVEN